MVADRSVIERNGCRNRLSTDRQDVHLARREVRDEQLSVRFVERDVGRMAAHGSYDITERGAGQWRRGHQNRCESRRKYNSFVAHNKVFERSDYKPESSANQ